MSASDQHRPYLHLPVILNPASGPDRPVLKILNTVFRAAGVDWDIYLTNFGVSLSQYSRQRAMRPSRKSTHTASSAM